MEDIPKAKPVHKKQYKQILPYLYKQICEKVCDFTIVVTNTKQVESLKDIKPFDNDLYDIRSIIYDQQALNKADEQVPRDIVVLSLIALHRASTLDVTRSCVYTIPDSSIVMCISQVATQTEIRVSGEPELSIKITPKYDMSKQIKVEYLIEN